MLADLASEIAFAILLGSVAALLFRAMAGRQHPQVARRVHCPVWGRMADCLLVRDLDTGGWRRVAHCPLRAARGRAACRSQCLRVLELKTAVRSGAPDPRR
jgi:hypothetical protein